MAWRVVLPSLMLAVLVTLGLLRPAPVRPPPSLPAPAAPDSIVPTVDPPRPDPPVATPPARAPVARLELLRRESFSNAELYAEIRRDPATWWPLLFSVLRDPSEKRRTRSTILHLIAELLPAGGRREVLALEATPNLYSRVVEVLGAYGGPGSASAILERYDRKRFFDDTLKALTQSGDPEGLAHLDRLLEDGLRQHRESEPLYREDGMDETVIAEAVGSIHERIAWAREALTLAAAPDAPARAAGLLFDDRIRAREWALTYLRRTPPADAAFTLRRAMDHQKRRPLRRRSMESWYESCLLTLLWDSGGPLTEGEAAWLPRSRSCGIPPPPE